MADRPPPRRGGPGPRGGPAPKGRRLAIGADPRRVAYDVLRAVSERAAYANLVLPELLRDARLPSNDAALATELAYGTLRATGTLDLVIETVSSRPLRELDTPVLNAVRLGAYQLLRTRVPSHAAVSATVGATYGVLSQGQAGFVNALLRKIALRTPDEWMERVAPDRSTDPLGHLGVVFAHPPWIVRAFHDALGGDIAETERALSADDERPAVHLVVRPGQLTRDELVAATGGTPGRWSRYAVLLDHGGDPAALPEVRSGSAAVQDEGSQLAALALADTPLDGRDETWVDLCAGPGGKAALLAGLAAERGAHLVAVEPQEHRARLVSQALRGYAAEVLVVDGRDTGMADGSADRVLVDAPCSGLGALRRRPEARWRREPSDLPPLTTLQRQLLDAAFRLVRPGGLVAYVTCSPHLAETRAVVRSVKPDLATLLDVRPHLADPRLDPPDPSSFPRDPSQNPRDPSLDASDSRLPDLGDGPWVQLWPHLHGTDAMFLALFRRSEA